MSDLEKAVEDLYGSRKGRGSIEVELNNMKADNEKLINLLKDTSEYQDLSSTVDVKNRFNYLSDQTINNICKSFGINTSVNKKSAAKAASKNGAGANEWIPTKAVEKIRAIQVKHDGKLSEAAIS